MLHDGASIAAPRVKRFLAPIHQRRARGLTGRKHRFSSLWYNLPRIQSSLPALLARAQTT